MNYQLQLLISIFIMIFILIFFIIKYLKNKNNKYLSAIVLIVSCLIAFILGLIYHKEYFFNSQKIIITVGLIIAIFISGIKDIKLVMHQKELKQMIQLLLYSAGMAIIIIFGLIFVLLFAATISSLFY